MKRIRREFNMPYESWNRVAQAVGEDMVEAAEEPMDQSQMTEDEADEMALDIMDYIYAQLETMPEGLGPLVLTRLADQIALQPAVQVVTAQVTDSLENWNPPSVGTDVSVEGYGQGRVDEVYPDGTYLVTLADVQTSGAYDWNQVLMGPKVVPAVLERL